jgi:NAD-dependent dihydropyrimidine dehydrogenase PreA subunit
MAFGSFAETMLEFGKGREISKPEALENFRKSEAEGMVFQPSNTQQAEYICSCCGCCCGQLMMQKFHPHPVEIWDSNHFVEVDPDMCSGCEACVEACQVDAMKINEDEGVSVVDLNRCIGCGNCVPVCPADAITLRKKEREVAPPIDFDAQQEILTTGK